MQELEIKLCSIQAQAHISEPPFELSTQNDTSGVNNIGTSQGWMAHIHALYNSSTPLVLYPHCGFTQGCIQMAELKLLTHMIQQN